MKEKLQSCKTLFSLLRVTVLDMCLKDITNGEKDENTLQILKEPGR